MSYIKRFQSSNSVSRYFSSQWDKNLAAEELPDFIQGSGMGGCFGKGTLVLTAHGYKSIDTLTLKDKVLGYDAFGVVDFGRIIDIPKHSKNDFVDDMYYISTDLGIVWPKGITGNHAVFDQATDSHKQIKDYAVGDFLVDYRGNLVAITQILIVAHADLPDYFEVYNLIISPQHTYICGTAKQWIRVHNGGGGKGGIPAQGGVEAPNTLQASSVAYVLDLLSHGTIVGINGGININEGIYFNNTQVVSTQGQQNFPGRILISGYYVNVYTQVATTLGTPDQAVIAGFTDVETVIYSQNQQVLFGNPVTVSIPDSNKQAVRVTLNFPNGLWSQNYNTGDINGSGVNFTIAVKSTTASTWTPVYGAGLVGKTTTQYLVDYIVPAPHECLVTPNLGWSIQVTRTSLDDAISVFQGNTSTFTLYAVTEILYQQNSYPNMALAALQIPAIAVNGSIPTRGYLVTGLIVQVPSNYDPIHRSYQGNLAAGIIDTSGTPLTYSGATNNGVISGYWDGSFKYAWTDNPAWILYDIITNVDYGLGKYLGVAVPVNIWSFYQASLYADCTVWNGPIANTYTKTLIANGIGSTQTITSASVYGGIGAPVTKAYITVPNNFITVYDTVTISGITGSLSILNGTFSVSEVLDGSNFIITIAATTVRATSTATGMGLIDNSTAGFEHRFLFNAPLTSQQDAWQLIQAIAGNMMSIVTVINGQITVVQDRPKAITRMFNTSAIIGGLFTYSTSEVTSRTTAVNITFNDKNNYYLPKTVSEWDNASVSLYGYISSDIVAFGCVDESQARRMARYALYTALQQPEICVFAVALNILDLTIGEVIGTQDNFKVRPTTQFINGRIVSATGINTTSVTFTLDRVITLLAGTYAFAVTAPDGAYIVQDNGSTVLQSYLYEGTIISPTGATSTNTITVSFATALPLCSTSYVNADFYSYCTASGDYIDQWTVQSISEESPGIYTLTCIQYNPNKYATVEGGLSFVPTPPPAGLIASALPAPGTITFQPIFSSTSIGQKSKLLIAWGWDTINNGAVNFNLQYQLNNENWVTITDLPTASYILTDVVPGIYNIIVTAVNLIGTVSPPTTNTYPFYLGVTTYTPLNVGSLSGNALVNGSGLFKGSSISTTINATSITIGQTYIINTIGTLGTNQTNFMPVGAANNIAGTSFMATGVPTGTGLVNSVSANTSAWDTYGFAQQGYNFPFSVRFSPLDLTSQFAVGFATNITTTDPETTLATIQYALYCNAGHLYVTESGTLSPVSGNYGAYNITDVLEVYYTGTHINYIQNGTVLKSTVFALTAGQSLYFNSVYYTPTGGIANLQFGTYTSLGISDLLPPINVYVRGTLGTTFAQEDLPVIWTENPANNQAVIQTYSGSGGVSGGNQLPLIAISGLLIGDTVQGIGVPYGTTIKNITGLTLTLSANLIATAFGQYSFNIPVSTLQDYVIEVVTSGGALLNEYIVPINGLGTGGSFDYSFLQNTTDNSGAASRIVYMRIYARDVLNNLSLSYTTVTFTNPQASVVSSFTVLPAVNAVMVTITPTGELDIAGYNCYQGSTAGFTPSSGNIVYSGTSDSFIIPVTNIITTYYYKVAAYDTFDQANLNFSPAIAALALSPSPAIWNQKGITFSETAGNTLNWSGGSLYQGLTSYTVPSGSAPYVSGTLYAYFDPTVSTSAIQTTTVLGNAVAQTAYPLASYVGGPASNILGGTGSAFISGSQVIAASIGASQLVSGSAVITGSAQIANGIIDTAHIANATITSAMINRILASTNYNQGAHTGWQLDNQGNFTSYGAFSLYDTSGNSIITAGGNINGAYISTASITNASIGSAAVQTLNIQGNAVTVPYSFSHGAGSLNVGTGFWAISQAITVYGNQILISAFIDLVSCFSGAVSGTYVSWIYQDAYMVIYIDGTAQNNPNSVTGPTTITISPTLSAGTHTIALYLACPLWPYSSGAAYWNSITLSTLETRK